jgi:PTS system mannose-specific IIA component
MIGIVLVTHGRLADEFRSAVEHVMGPQPQMATICIEPQDNIDNRRQEILAAVKQVNSGDGVAILTDMFGGTPSNLAISVMNEPNIEVVAGINLPMLVKLATVRGELALAEAVTQAQAAGRKYINIASHVLAGE